MFISVLFIQISCDTFAQEKDKPKNENIVETIQIINGDTVFHEISNSAHPIIRKSGSDPRVIMFHPDGNTHNVNIDSLIETMTEIKFEDAVIVNGQDVRIMKYGASDDSDGKMKKMNKNVYIYKSDINNAHVKDHGINVDSIVNHVMKEIKLEGVETFTEEEVRKIGAVMRKEMKSIDIDGNKKTKIMIWQEIESGDGDHSQREIIIRCIDGQTFNYVIDEEESEDGNTTITKVEVIEGDNNEKSKESKLGLQLYPNPAKDYFTLEFELTDDDPATIEVIDVNGRKLFEKTYKQKGRYKEKIDTPEMKEGIYIVNLNQKRRSISKKVIIR